MVESALSIMAVFNKQCIKPFVEGLPGILSFIASHYQINLASLIANWYVYWDLFAEFGYVRDRGFNVLHLGRHGGMIGAQFFLKSLVIKFSAHSRLCQQIELQKLRQWMAWPQEPRKLAVGVSKLYEFKV